MDLTTTTTMTTQESLSRGLETVASAATDAVKQGDNGFVTKHFGLFIFTVAGTISLVIILSMALREYYWRKYGVDVCPGTGPRGRTTDVSNQIISDAEMAQELQRQINEEIREQERIEKRKERRTWYESFIKPYTMEVQQKDIFHAGEDGATTTHKQSSVRSIIQSLKKSPSSTDLDDEAEELEIVEDDKSNIMDLEQGGPVLSKESERTASTTDSSESMEGDHDDQEQELTQSNSSDDETHVYLRLPEKDGKPRCVDAHCAICLGEYEAGDKVVWSALDDCKHCFHDECILPWLSKGKKRCPICRQWFVPGTKIDDQKAALEEMTQSGSSEENNDQVVTSTSENSGEGIPTSSTPQQEGSLSVSHPTEDLENAPITLAATMTQETNLSTSCGQHPQMEGVVYDDLEMGVAPNQIATTNPAA